MQVVTAVGGVLFNEDNRYLKTMHSAVIDDVNTSGIGNITGLCHLNSNFQI